MNDTVIETMPGVDQPSDGPGVVTVITDDDSTMVDLEVLDHEGNRALVHLGYNQVVALMVELGRAASTL